MWLPAGWLLVLLLLTASAPAWGDRVTSDGWRKRAASPSRAFQTSQSSRTRWDRSLRAVGYEEDIAGPALRVAQRERTNARDLVRRDYRLAQQDTSPRESLEELMERPLGVDADRSTDARTYEELPADPFDEPPFQRGSEANEDDSSGYIQSPAEEDDLADDIAAPFGQDSTFDRDYQDDRLAEEVAAAQESCAEEFAELKANRLSTVDLSIGVAGVPGEDFPFICSIDDGTVGAPRCWAEITYMWKASALCHKPLYFEDVALERYGHSWGPFVQPIMSGAHFFGRLPILPYCMGLKTPNECVYTLGHYRPGNCAPYLVGGVPFTWRAALFQAGGAVGVAAFLP